MDEKSLETLRELIDTIDDKIVDLLSERFQLTSKVSSLKKAQDLPVYQSDREQRILKRVVAKGRALGLNGLLLQALFLQIFSVSKRDQQDQV